MSALFDKIFGPKSILALSCKVESDGSVSLASARVKRRKDRIEIEQDTNGFLALDKWDSNTKVECPAIAMVWGKGVLNRFVKTRNSSQEEILGEIIPGGSSNNYKLDAASFYDQQLVTVCRWDVLESIEKLLKDKGYDTFEIILGARGAELAADIFKRKSVQMGSDSLEDSDSNWAISKIQDDMILEGAKFDGFHYKKVLEPCIAYCVACLAKLQRPPFWQDLTYRNAFKSIGIAGLTALFVTLAINTLVFQQLNDDVQLLSSQVSTHKSNFALVDSLKKDIAQRNQILNHSGSGNSWSKTEVLDNICSQIPAGVTLNSFSVIPREGKADSSKPIRFLQDQLVVSGIVAEESVLSEWIKELNDLEVIDWVKIESVTTESSGKEFVLSLKCV